MMERTLAGEIRNPITKDIVFKLFVRLLGVSWIICSGILGRELESTPRFIDSDEVTKRPLFISTTGSIPDLVLNIDGMITIIDIQRSVKPELFDRIYRYGTVLVASSELDVNLGIISRLRIVICIAEEKINDDEGVIFRANTDKPSRNPHLTSPVYVYYI